MEVRLGRCNGNEPSVARSRKNAEPDRHARDLHRALGRRFAAQGGYGVAPADVRRRGLLLAGKPAPVVGVLGPARAHRVADPARGFHVRRPHPWSAEEHTSELPSLMRYLSAAIRLTK